MSSLQAPAIPSSPTASPPRKSSQGRLSCWWLQTLFSLAIHHEWVIRSLQGLAARVAIACVPKARRATGANARRLLGPQISAHQQRAFGRRVINRFIDFVVDTAQGVKQSPEQLRARIESVEGHDRYVAVRAQKRGAIIVTAHMGSFELGMAALTAIEPNVHVVFKRDELDGFEAIRRSMRKTLGVQEAAIDDGWSTWMQLRDALKNDHVVVLQGDRSMPGQKSQIVPLAGGHVALPLGPWVLAAASGAPIVPIFTVVTRRGHCKLCVEEPIDVDSQAEPIDGVPPALRQLAATIERYVKAYPEQWLMLDYAFIDDAPARSAPVKTPAAKPLTTGVA